MGFAWRQQARPLGRLSVFRTGTAIHNPGRAITGFIMGLRCETPMCKTPPTKSGSPRANIRILLAFVPVGLAVPKVLVYIATIEWPGDTEILRAGTSNSSSKFVRRSELD